MYLKGLELGWAAAAKRKQPKNQKICAVCGKHFIRRGNRNIRTFHCSVQCKAKSQIGKPKFRPKLGPIKACMICGKSFQRPPSQESDCCSFACSLKRPDRFAAITGSRHYNWKGGITPHNVAIRTSVASRAWTLAVFRRDGFKCQICGVSRDLQAHHKLHWAEFPALRLDLSNGITLCRNHHKIIHWCGRHFTSKINKALDGNYEY